MRIVALRLANVRRFSPGGKAIESIGDGLNVLAAENEFGKSTLFEALKMVLFAKHTAKDKSVRSLQPLQSSKAPLIEIDLRLGDGLFRVTKRYLRRQMAEVRDVASGRLLAHGDGAEDWIKSAFKFDASAKGPFGLLWVSQGDSVSEIFDRNDASGRAKFLSDLVQKEIQAVAAGSLVSDVLAKARADLSGMVTQGHNKPTGDYKKTAATIEQLEAEVASLREDIAASDAMRQSFQHLTAVLDSVDSEKKHAALRQKRDTARAEAHVGKELRRRMQELREQKTLAVRNIAALDRQQKQIGEAEKALEQLLRKKIQIESDLAGVADKLAEAGKEKDLALKAVKDAEAELASLRRQLRTAMAARALGDCEEALARALADGERFATLTQQRTELAALLKAQSVSEESVKILEDCERQLQRQMAQQQAPTIEVRVSYEAGSKKKVRLDGAALEEGSQVRSTGPLELTIDDVGKLSVIPGREDGQNDPRLALEAAQSKLEDQRQRSGFASGEAARAALRKKQRLQDDLERLADEIERLAPEGADGIEARINALKVRMRDLKDGSPAVRDKAELESLRVSDAEQAVSARDEDLVAAHGRLAAAEKTHGALSETRTRLETQLADLNEHLSSLQEDDAGERATRQAALSSELTEVRGQLAKIEEALAAAEQGLGEAELRQQALETAEAELASFERELRSKRDERARLEGALDQENAHGLGERLAAAEEALDAARQKIGAYEREVRALLLLTGEVERAQTEAKDAFLAPVLREALPLLRMVLPEAGLDFSDGFEPNRLVRDGRAEGLEQLSLGTQEQVAIITRLAFARLFAREGVDVPVVLDDALVFSDDRRLEAMFSVLGETAKEVQVLFLTCRLSAFKGLAANYLTVSDWQPPQD